MTLWNISIRLAACTSSGRHLLNCNGPMVARPSWILPMIMSAPANSILCMGQVRQARFNHSGKAADLYISGHRHTWGLMSTEMQGRVVWMCRAKGFKDHGEYEVVKGFEAQKLGHTITAIFDPSADTETGFLSCFAEPQEAAEFLTYKRGR